MALWNIFDENAERGILWPEFESIVFNVVEGKSADWGVSSSRLFSRLLIRIVDLTMACVFDATHPQIGLCLPFTTGSRCGLPMVRAMQTCKKKAYSSGRVDDARLWGSRRDHEYTWAQGDKVYLLPYASLERCCSPRRC